MFLSQDVSFPFFASCTCKYFDNESKVIEKITINLLHEDLQLSPVLSNV